MHQWDLCPVTPAASLMSRCVSRGTLSQDQIDSASSRPSPAVSPVLLEAERHIGTWRQLSELQLQVALLRVEKQSADVTSTQSLIQRFHTLQMFCSHLQELLKEQNSLRQRLMRPLGRTNLPIKAHLQRPVTLVMKMLLDFIETLEEKLDLVHSCTTTRDQLNELNTFLAQLLSQAAEVQSLSKQVLQ